MQFRAILTIKIDPNNIVIVREKIGFDDLRGQIHSDFEKSANLFVGTIVRSVAHLIFHVVRLIIQKSRELSTISV